MRLIELIYPQVLAVISGRIKLNIEMISKGQMNKNVRKTGIKTFDNISKAINDFLVKIRNIIS